MKLSDLDNTRPITLKEGSTFLDLLGEVAGVGKVVKGVNTTPDVKVGEIARQAAKMGFKTTSDGVPPVASTNGKFNQIKVKKMGATKRSHYP
jgi:hypothetical protein